MLQLQMPLITLFFASVFIEKKMLLLSYVVDIKIYELFRAVLIAI